MPWAIGDLLGGLASDVETVDSDEVATVFDAVHLADAFRRWAALHTADERLFRTPFPTVGF